MNFVTVVIGGAIGASLRWSIAQLLSGFVTTHHITFPLITLGVNTLGSFLLGLLIGGVTSSSESLLYTFLGIGVLGSFTTFSTFSVDNLFLIKNEQLSLALLYSFSSVILGIWASFLGYFIGIKVS